MNINDLWEKYTRNKDPKLREELILYYVHLVKYIAGRLYVSYNNTVEYDDLVSYGIFGLIDAIDKYEFNRGVKFETYAHLRIRGAIIDYLREIDWIPRSVRQKAKELEKAYIEVEMEKGSNAKDKDVAEKLGITESELQKRIQSLSTYSVVSLDEYLDQHREITVDFINESNVNPTSRIEIEEFRKGLAEAIKALPEKEKKIITLYYFEELTYKEIGSILAISESRVSQLHTKAILKLKAKLALLF
ncbi:FliA/WhiG family RNA polymerase sigma factor [Lutispora thermophila]|uniref:RNA polymerase sigma factor n=1 Tax=Lutispora thermophila DSM 19022 TaxID=1122184 RepID=A0A1M6G8I0_9FIRM|nr:FliA/WhiG family RNA polymerase sigma factor [Lutispora thermophila]SHJ06241.1 RNA polymerase, sigma 28 subunit, SigD/FliA/WhiG [Lutispora thermophila DSM 19022]